MTSADLMAAQAVPLGPATSASRLAELAAASPVATRLRVAQHPNTDIETLVRLAEDSEQVVRGEAVRRLAG